MTGHCAASGGQWHGTTHPQAHRIASQQDRGKQREDGPTSGLVSAALMIKLPMEWPTKDRAPRGLQVGKQ